MTRTCARCGKRLGESHIYSRWTKARYCRNVTACLRRKVAA